MNLPVADESVLQRFDGLRDEVLRLVSNEAELHDKIKQLEIDLQVYKRIFSDTNAEKKRIEEENDQLRQNSEKNLEKHAPVSRVMALLDGDGAIFMPQLIALGLKGGHKGASKLSESITDYVHSLNKNQQFQLSVYIFFNKRGLIETLSRCDYHSSKAHLDDFVTGFNQASERFIMVDVGNGKEAADAKIKALLDDEIRLPQTYKILFGGCHDNGYTTTIRSHITSGFKHKLILLQSYTEHAAGFDSLGLPSLTIPGLFITQKLVGSTLNQDTIGASRSLSPPLSDALIQNPVAFQGFGRGEFSRVLDLGTQGFFSPPMHPTALPNRAAEHFTPQGANSGGTHDYDHSEADYHSNINVTVSRRPDPTLPLSKQKPPVCTLYYLKSGCKSGAKCKYAHDYVLQPEHYTEIKAYAKKAPCPAANKNQNCAWGDTCFYGHECPSGMSCFFFKKGKCRFTGAGMHKPKNNNVDVN